ncbi:NAD(P)-dependent oxidoreductase [Pseudoflavonifractor phocaeensis]|uniref:precorrin-2 dehydrogenase/sirohydrochlorin ferrochelatase family protein n=1 Tax=Pseudoflavonifractor phocaeensis TaxID=1870988 RepID=UPI001959F346|nr:NAD(P)-dependent oxidoreductase [Pseudoflavonifractor phocaeensis]MBM6937669.1 NAD(P)-dependent oxidoreductase [Pseudoflavonifractor phocaeensis]
MEENLRFPLFVDLRGRRAVVVGGGRIALRRAKGLRDFGADVTVIAPHLAQPMEGITHLCRSYAPGDLTGAFLAVAATDDRAVNRAVGEEARRQSIPVSVADQAEECTFFFPALCTGNGMIAGVVSDGTDHHKTAAAAKAIRAVLEELE